jgi:hypothetical protein
MGHRAERGGLWRSRWAAIGAAVAVSVGAGGVVQWASAASGPRSDFISITPLRVLDSRNGVDVGLPGPFVSPVSQDLTITGNVPTTTGAQIVVPPGATGVVLNVTVVQPTLAGFVSVRPADAPGAPATSSLNFEAGVTQPNAVTVQLPTSGADAGKIELTYDAYGSAGATTDLLVDVVGYYAPAGPPVTETVTIPWSDFAPAASGEYAYAASGHAGRSLTGVGGNGGNRLHTALVLPQGVTITGVTFGVRDNAASTPSVGLYRFPKTGVFGEDVAVADVPGAEAGVREVAPPVDPSRAVVDNTQFSYVLTMFMPVWTTNTVEIIYATVTYTSPS